MKTISTLGLLQARTANLRQLENSLAAKQQEVATGKPTDVGRTAGNQLANLLALRNSFNENEAVQQSIDTFERRASVMMAAMSQVENAANSLQSNVVLNVPDASESVLAVGTTARATGSALTSALNTTVDGRFLFSGTAIDVSPYTDFEAINPGTGLSPAAVIDEILNGTAFVPVQPPAFTAFSAVEAADAVARINAVFDGTNASSAPPLNSYSFERTFYSGSIGSAPISVDLDGASPVAYGVAGDEQPFRDLMQGIAMLSSVDLVELAGTDAYEPYVTSALEKLSAGLDGLRTTMANLGSVQQQAEEVSARLAAEDVVLAQNLALLERVDQIEAQSRFTEIERQLDASYAATVRVGRLRLTNYL